VTLRRLQKSDWIILRREPSETFEFVRDRYKSAMNIKQKNRKTQTTMDDHHQYPTVEEENEAENDFQPGCDHLIAFIKHKKMKFNADDLKKEAASYEAQRKIYRETGLKLFELEKNEFEIPCEKIQERALLSNLFLTPAQQARIKKICKKTRIGKSALNNYVRADPKLKKLWEKREKPETSHIKPQPKKSKHNCADELKALLAPLEAKVNELQNRVDVLENIHKKKVNFSPIPAQFKMSPFNSPNPNLFSNSYDGYDGGLPRQLALDES